MSTAASVPMPETAARAEAAPGAGTVRERFCRLIPIDFARRHLLVASEPDPDGRGVRLLIGPETSPVAVHNVAVRLRASVETREAPAEDVARRIESLYAEARRSGPAMAEGRAGDGDGALRSPLAAGEAGVAVDELLAAADRDLLSTGGKSPVVRLVDALLFEALSLGASDVHVQPLADRTLVRYRVDGVLQDARELPRATAQAVVSRIKVMGRMDIAERRAPQDGRATVTVGRPLADEAAAEEPTPDGEARSSGGRAIDLRISTLPTAHGERAVVRILDTDRGLRLADFEQIGMPDDVRRRYLDRASRANGIVLLTGPTGSGKTTTLYATLRWITRQGASARSGRGGALNVMTIEDPIEYELSSVGVAVSQAQVEPRKGVTFASGLRHILRQDPDVVMVGEIRDAETARTAVQAALTGHLVLSTLHTNDAPSAVPRLIDLGVEPYLVAASLSAVLAQRLVRTLHAACGGAGCPACFGTGLQGRTGLFELMCVEGGLREMIARGAPAAELRSAAVAGGMAGLMEMGDELVRRGVTTRVEVSRVAHGMVDDGPAAAAAGPGKEGAA